MSNNKPKVREGSRADFELRHYDRIATVVFSILVVLLLYIWSTRGVTLYEGNTYYIADTQTSPTVDNVTFSHNSDGTYTAKLLGIFPVGNVNIISLERPCMYTSCHQVLVRGENSAIEIVGFDEEGGSPAMDAGLLIGDRLLTVDGQQVVSSPQLREILDADVDTHVVVEYERDGVVSTIEFDLREDHYMGIQVKPWALVLGSISFITEDGYFCAIGHSTDDCNLMDCEVLQIETEFDKENGDLVLSAQLSEELGTIISSNYFGIVGTAVEDWKRAGMREMAWEWEIDTEAPAYVMIPNEKGYTQVKGDITQLTGMLADENQQILKGSYYKIELEDGQFAAGMSGSPVIQNDRLIGVITAMNMDNHVEGFFIPADVIYAQMLNATSGLDVNMEVN